MPKLSIIIPVYQVEKYVHPCLESVFKQGLDDSDFEVIIVNDGTKDRSMEMIADIIRQHRNITVVNQENQGLSVARNNGMARAKGEYILLLDSDDLLIENSLKALLDKALETQADLAVADFLMMSDEEIGHLPFIPQKEFCYTEKRDGNIFLEVLNPGLCYVWRTLYRRAFITSHQLSFYPGIQYEDVPFTHECYLKAKHCIKTNRLLYIYRRWPGSITGTFSIKKAKDFIISIAKTWDLRQTKGLSPEALYKLEEDVYASFRLMMYHTLHCIKLKAERNEIMDYLNQHIPDLYFTHGIQQRLITMMVKKMPYLFINLYYQFAQIVYKRTKIWKK